MNTKVINDLLSDVDKARLLDAIANEFKTRPEARHKFPREDRDVNNHTAYYDGYGRIDIKHPKIPKDILDKIYRLVEEHLDDEYKPVTFDFAMYGEYTKRSGGDPKLEPHFDSAESATVILDYQIESNTDWEIKIESDLFLLDDNSGLLFDPLCNIHSRIIKDFNDEDFVKMLFFRFKSSNTISPKTIEDEKRLQKEHISYGRELHEKTILKNNQIRDGV
jgi:hypothetical protein